MPDFSYPNWLKPKTEPWQVIAMVGEQVGTALARNREFQFRAKQVEQDNVLRMREADLREESLTLANQDRLQGMNLKAIEFQRDSAAQPLLEQYQRTLQTWDASRGDPPPPPAGLPSRLMGQAITYRNTIMQSEAMLERKRVLGELASFESKVQSSMLESAMRLREVGGPNAIEFHPEFGPRVNKAVLDQGWNKYNEGRGVNPSGMTPTTYRRRMPDGSWVTYSDPPPTKTKTLEQYRMQEFPKRKVAYATDPQRRKMTDAQIMAEVNSEYAQMTGQSPASPSPAAAAQTPAVSTPRPAAAAAPKQAFKVGQRVIQKGVMYEYNGMDWTPVNTGGR